MVLVKYHMDSSYYSVWSAVWISANQSSLRLRCCSYKVSVIYIQCRGGVVILVPDSRKKWMLRPRRVQEDSVAIVANFHTNYHVSARRLMSTTGSVSFSVITFSGLYFTSSDGLWEYPHIDWLSSLLLRLIRQKYS